MKFFFIYTALAVYYLFVPSAYAQLTVVQGSSMNMTPEQLVQNYLIGPGVTVSNVTYNGSSALISSNQIGTFSTSGMAATQLGLNGGVIITSGKADIAIGPNNSPGAGFNGGGAGDQDLTTISGSATHDRCVIEFDFIPQSDTIKFRYVFSSEEFFEYCDQFNDAFGFFLSGPGINGSFSNNSVNIALMPDDNTKYVTINNVCGDSLASWSNTGGINYEYDGMTYVLTAWHVVTPCQVYHIKLAIADAVDYSFDSGVFLEKNSFASPSVALSVENTQPVLNNKALEGCNDVKVNFVLESPLTSAYTIRYTIGGTASNGTDYAFIPDHITFPAGTDTVFLIIHPLPDGLTEDPESVIITVNQNSCNGMIMTDTVVIDEYTPMTVDLGKDTSVCEGSSIKLTAHVSGGLPPYSYQWSNGTGTDSILNIILPAGNNEIVSSVTDVCPNSVSDVSVVKVNPKPVAFAGNDIAVPNGTATTLNGRVSGGTGNFTYNWTSIPAGFTSDLQNPSTGNIYHTTIFILSVTDKETGCISDPSQITVAIEGGDLTANPVAEPDSVCSGDPVNLFALGGGGSGSYSYSWNSFPSGFASSSASPVVNPEETTTYNVSINDGITTVQSSVTVNVIPPPHIYLGPADTTVCMYDSIKLDAGNPGSDYKWSNGSSSRVITVGSGGKSFDVQSFVVHVTNANGCSDSAFINVVFSFEGCVGINDLQEFRDFDFYPNPNNGTFRLSMKPREDITFIDVYNISGQKVYHEKIESSAGKLYEEMISIPEAASGIYLLQISGSNYSGTKKLIIK